MTRLLLFLRPFIFGPSLGRGILELRLPGFLYKTKVCPLLPQQRKGYLFSTSCRRSLPPQADLWNYYFQIADPLQSPGMPHTLKEAAKKLSRSCFVVASAKPSPRTGHVLPQQALTVQYSTQNASTSPVPNTAQLLPKQALTVQSTKCLNKPCPQYSTTIA